LHACFAEPSTLWAVLDRDDLKGGVVKVLLLLGLVPGLGLGGFSDAFVTGLGDQMGDE